MKQLYLIDYENMHWCGGQLNCVVWAESPADAEEIASDFMEETQRELFADEYEDDEEGEYSDEQAYTVNSVEVLDETNEHWNFFMDPTQSQFYPMVNV